MKQLYFPTPVWHFQAGEQYLNCLQQQLVEIDNLRTSGYGSEGNSRSSVIGWRLDSAERVKKLHKTKDEVIRLLQIILRDKNSFDQKKIYGCEMTSWINATDPGGHNKMHHHGLADLSGVFYLKCPENCGSLTLRDPRPAVFFNKFNKSLLRGGYREVVVTPSVGKCVFFPGFLEHSVEVNQSQEVRISYSFNLNISAKTKT